VRIGDVEFDEVVLVVLEFGALGDIEAHAGEDLDQFGADAGDDVSPSQVAGVDQARFGHVDHRSGLGLRRSGGRLTLGEGGLERGLDLVETLAHGGLLVRGDILHARHEGAEFALGPDIGNTPGFQGLGPVGGGEFGESFGLDRAEVFEHGR